MKLRLVRRNLLLGSAFVVAGVAGSGYSRGAYAACIASPSPTYICAGAETTTQSILNVTDATVSTVPGFSVDTRLPDGGGGNGIEITGDGDISFTDANKSDISGNTNGLFIRGLGGTGGGSVTVDVTGDVTGATRNGIYAGNNTGGTSLKVTTGTESAITGAVNGIFAQNYGSGALTVTANGDVTGEGASFNGISAFNSKSGTYLKVTTGEESAITGGFHGIRAVNYGSGDLEVTADGDVEGKTRDGIYALNSSTSTGGLTLTTGAGSDIYGKVYGIRAQNYGTGDLDITADGDVTGETKDGIYAYNSKPGTDLKVTTGEESAVTGGYNGINVRNRGKGDLSITADGDVTGKSFDGIIARNYGANLKVTTDEESAIAGQLSGINARNLGTGELSITADGDVTGKSFYGIHAYNSKYGTSLQVTTGEESNIYGKTYGINARNYGTGDLDITADGDVTGETRDGIYAFNSKASTDLTVTTGAQSDIDGEHRGIYARNHGTGALSVEANGDVTGMTYEGIYARNYNTINARELKVTTGVDSVIYGKGVGVYARNEGTGALSIEANGDVTGMTSIGIAATNLFSVNTGGMTVTTGAKSNIVGYGTGISAQNAGTGALIVEVNGDVTGMTVEGINAYNESASNTGGMTVTTGAESAIEGKYWGVRAFNDGIGALDITADGDVTGGIRDGIFARNYNTANANELRVTTGAESVISGGRWGIYARNNGTGALSVEANGDVTGGAVGIYASALSDLSTIAITVGGSVQNASGEAFDLAIQATGAATTLDNGGVTTGRIILSDFDDNVTNTDTWNTAGDSEFGGGEDELLNQGRINAGGTRDVADTTQLLSLERLRNAGTISMIDQAPGDYGANKSDSLIVSGDYEGEGGTLAVDAFLGGPGSMADVFTIQGSSSGTTFVTVNDTSAFGAYNPDGILVVNVLGNSAASDFALADGPINSGLYAYDLIYDDSGKYGQFLLQSFVGVGTFEVAAVVSGAQNIFFDTTTSWVERQNSLRDWYGKRNVVVAVADPPVAEEVNETGLWLTVRGSKTDREAHDRTEAFGNAYVFDTGYDQDTFSLMGGADFGTSLGGDGTLLFGVLAGYFTSEQDLNGSATDIEYEGGSLGAYATYLNGGFFADLLGKVDFYDVDYDAARGGGDDTDGTNWGFRGDVGYRIAASDSFYIEPVASLAAVWTDIDNFALYDTTARPGSNDAVQLGGGARIGWEMAAIDLSLTGRVWDVVSGGNDVGIIVPGTSLTSVSDSSFTGVFGEVSGQIGYSLTERANVYVAGSYLFNDEQKTLSGAAGLSFSW